MKSRGFTLLFAALVGALVIAVGMAILNITLKQLILASAGKASQQAFYAADAGVECALYLDRGSGLPGCELGVFGTPSTTLSSGYSVCGVDSASAPYIHTEDIECFGHTIDFTPTPRPSALNPTSVENTFAITTNTGNNEDLCFTVTVLKSLNDGTATTTVIESRGYNTCNQNAANRFERAIRTVNQ